MAKIFSDMISGTILSVSVFQPQQGQKSKTHIRIEILQMFDGGTNVAIVKDTDLTKISDYRVGSRFNSPCMVSNYTMGNSDGLSIYVFNGKQIDLPFSINSVPEKSEPRKTAAI